MANHVADYIRLPPAGNKNREPALDLGLFSFFGNIARVKAMPYADEPWNEIVEPAEDQQTGKNPEQRFV